MNLHTEIAVAVLTELQSAGYLKRGVQHDDAALLPKVAEIVLERLYNERVMLAKFIVWWAELGHQAHAENQGASLVLARSFRYCQEPICLSLVGTLTGLELEQKDVAFQWSMPTAI